MKKNSQLHKYQISLCLIFFLVISLLYLLHIFNFTYPKDGVLYYFISENLSENNFKIDNFNLTSIDINETLHTTQIGIAFILALFKKVFFSNFLITFIFFIFLLWCTVIIYFHRLARIISVNYLFIYIFLLLVFFQIDNIKALTSFYNESFYFPLFIINTIIFLEKFHNNKNITNYKIDYFFITIFFLFGIFFQLFHIFICLIFFLTVCTVKKNILLKNYKLILYIIFLSIISFLLFYFFLEHSKNNNIIKLNNINSNFENSVNFLYQKLFNIFVSPLNFHVFLTKLISPQNNLENGNWGFVEYLTTFSLACLFLYCFLKNYQKKLIDKLTILIIIFSFLSKVLISDYDIRYNIYSNIFILYYYVLELFKFKIAKNKNIFILIIIFLIICVTTKLNNYFVKMDRNTFYYLSFLKNKNLTFKNTKFDNSIILSNINTRLLYWITGKRVCQIRNYKKCFYSNKNYLIIYVTNNQDLLEEKIMNELIRDYPGKFNLNENYFILNQQ